MYASLKCVVHPRQIFIFIALHHSPPEGSVRAACRPMHSCLYILDTDSGINFQVRRADTVKINDRKNRSCVRAACAHSPIQTANEQRPYIAMRNPKTKKSNNTVGAGFVPLTRNSFLQLPFLACETWNRGCQATSSSNPAFSFWNLKSYKMGWQVSPTRQVTLPLVRFPFPTFGI